MFQVWQIVLITLYAFIQPNETAGFKIGMNSPILAGWFTGLVLGNPVEGLFLGGTLQLMTLGVATYGGMSIPNTVVGAIVGTALSMYMDMELALGIAIGLAAAGGAVAMGVAVSKSAEGIARQPEAEGKIRTTLMLGLVFIETAIIYALLVVILIIFVL